MDRYKQWAAEINGSWDQAVPAFIQTGVKLKEAKDDLGHGNFRKAFFGPRRERKMLRFGQGMAIVLMRSRWV
jgi:hypothetical protein